MPTLSQQFFAGCSLLPDQCATRTSLRFIKCCNLNFKILARKMYTMSPFYHRQMINITVACSLATRHFCMVSKRFSFCASSIDTTNLLSMLTIFHYYTAQRMYPATLIDGKLLCGWPRSGSSDVQIQGSSTRSDFIVVDWQILRSASEDTYHAYKSFLQLTPCKT